MPDPARALLVFFALVAVLAAVSWPGVGLWPRLRRLQRLTERVRLEDALKHLTNCALTGRQGSIESLAGTLEMSRVEAARLASRLAARGLVQSAGEGVALTDEGRVYGLRILRAHRLLERYFADRTGIAPGQWHEEAEAREHSLTPAEADSLAASMGHPLYDPHGDPIPMPGGALPPRSGRPLATLPPGTVAAVVHLEDEPREVYDRLRGVGLNPGVPVKLLESGPGGIRILVAGRETTLDPALTGNVHVEPVPERDTHTVLMERLDALRPGERGTVAEIAPSVQGPQRRRLLDLGLIPGTEVEAEMVSPSGDPVAYRIRGALIALRQQQAQGIYITRGMSGPQAA